MSYGQEQLERNTNPRKSAEQFNKKQVTVYHLIGVGCTPETKSDKEQILGTYKDFESMPAEVEGYKMLRVIPSKKIVNYLDKIPDYKPSDRMKGIYT